MKNSVSPAILLALALAAILKLFCFDYIVVEGESMSPAVKNGSLLLVNKLAYGFRPPFTRRYLASWALPHPGDVVLFYTPYGDLAVKRCFRLSDDEEDFDGRPHFIAHGDNSAASFDSRSYGPVPVDNVIGRAVGY